MKAYNAILIMIPLISLLFVGCSNVDSDEVENKKSELFSYFVDKDYHRNGVVAKLFNEIIIESRKKI